MRSFVETMVSLGMPLFRISDSDSGTDHTAVMYISAD